MALTVNTNTLSLTAQNNLSQSQKALGSAIERLSSGSKINSAKDDAAGQAIANRMTAQINGLSQASSNANDGISLAQTTEGALDQVNDNLQRVRELTVQAANGTNSQSDLESIQNEITQRMDEINRTSEQTSFNGTKVLDGSTTKIDIQVGYNDNETISINLQAVDQATLNLTGFNVDGYDGSLAASTKTFTDDDGNDAGGAVTFVDQNGDAVTGTLNQDESGKQFVTVTGANPDGTDANYAVTGTDVTTGPTGDGTDSTVELTVNTERSLGARSEDPLAALDSALKQVDELRSDLGAAQNRFDSAINNITTTTTNISSARSRIEDADYATEVSNLSKAQILQQAGTSVLAQANQTGQGVLSLLG